MAKARFVWKKRENFVLLLMGSVTLIFAAAMFSLFRSNQPDRGVKLMVLLFSNPEDVYYRTAARSTFLRRLPKGGRASAIFALGEIMGDREEDLVARESFVHRDIITLPGISNSEEEETIRTLLAYKYINDHGKVGIFKPDYVLVSHKNVYARLPELLEYLSDKPRKQFYLGRYPGDKKPVRDKSNKWYIGYDEYQFATYPPHFIADGYVISSDLVESLAACVPLNPACASSDGYKSCEVSDCCGFQPIRYVDVTVGGIVMSAITKRLRFDLDCTEPSCKGWADAYKAKMFTNNSLVDAFKSENLCSGEAIIQSGTTENTVRDLHLAVLAKEAEDSNIMKEICDPKKHN